MKHVKILDTTLRDGGRIINCAFLDDQIKGITQGLTDAGVDIIEMGFLRSGIDYHGNSVYFSDIEQIKPFIPQDRRSSMYVAFADYGKEFSMWDFSKLPPCDGASVTGIRVGYRKKDLLDAVNTFHQVQDRGYTLFIQGVESLNYTDREMLEAVDVINRIKPYSFGIVDTYGAMYKDDVLRLYNLVHNNLDPDIAIDFHSHNNLQLSFSFAQEIVEASAGKRAVVVDATMEGVGKGIGNLNTELIMDYLNRKHGYNYDMDRLFDTIDEYISYLKESHTWAYQIPYFMAGIYSSHANNISYLTEKHRLQTKDIKHILSMIEPEKRKRYDYDNIERLYIEYFSSKVDDAGDFKKLRGILADREVLVMVPGASLTTCADRIKAYIDAADPVVITVNHVRGKGENIFAFYGNQRRYDHDAEERRGANVIISSNILAHGDTDMVFNYNSLINREYVLFDNSTIMLLNLLKETPCKGISIAGFDGYKENAAENYAADYTGGRRRYNASHTNAALDKLLRHYVKQLPEGVRVTFVTPSRFENIFHTGERE